MALHEVRDRPASAGGEDTAGPPWGLTWPALERRVRPALGGRTGDLALVGVHAAGPGEMPWGRRPGEEGAALGGRRPGGRHPGGRHPGEEGAAPGRRGQP